MSATPPRVAAHRKPDAVLERSEPLLPQWPRLASATAFDLLPTLDGAALVWAERGSGGAIRAQRLSKLGEARGAPRDWVAADARRGQVHDLVVGSGGAGTVVGWLEHLGGQARASAVMLRQGGQGPVADLGQAWYTSRDVRGNLAAAVGQESALVFVRGQREPCSGGQRDCFGFVLQRLEVSGVRRARGLPLSVPVPCSEHSVHVAVTEGRWHYAVCTLDGQKPVTTVFNIQFEPEYAEADQFLAGCRPRGLLELEGRVWLGGECDGKVQLVSVRGQPAVGRLLTDAELACRAGGLLLVSPEWTYRFERAFEQLHELLPVRFVPKRGRAIWTGRALLVASESGGRLQLTRYACGT